MQTPSLYIESTNDMYIMYSYLLIDQMVGKPHPVNIPMMARGSEAGSPPSSAP